MHIIKLANKIEQKYFLKIAEKDQEKLKQTILNKSEWGGEFLIDNKKLISSLAEDNTHIDLYIYPELNYKVSLGFDPSLPQETRIKYNKLAEVVSNYLKRHGKALGFTEPGMWKITLP